MVKVVSVSELRYGELTVAWGISQVPGGKEQAPGKVLSAAATLQCDGQRTLAILILGWYVQKQTDGMWPLRLCDPYLPRLLKKENVC